MMTTETLPRDDIDLSARLLALPADAEAAAMDQDLTAAAWEGEVKKAAHDLALYGVGARRKRTGPMFIPVASLEHMVFPKVPWLIPGLLRELGVNAVAGEPKVAKTWAGIEMCMAIATGTPAFGEFVTGPPRACAMFLVEDDLQNVRNRVRALAAGRGMSFAEASRLLHIEARTPIDVRDPEDLADFVASCRRLPEPPAVVMLDPLRDLHTGDEDKSGEMSPTMGAFRALRSVLNAAVIFCHHNVKGGKETAGRRPGQKMRGSSAIHGAVDGVLSFAEVKGDGRAHWDNRMHSELRAGRAAGWFDLKLDVVDDSGGEAVEARWTFSRKDGDVGPRLPTSSDTAPHKIESAILRVLKKQWESDRRADRDPVPLSETVLASATQHSRKGIHAAICRLAPQGRVTVLSAEIGVRNPKDAGVIYHPTTDELEE